MEGRAVLAEHTAGSGEFVVYSSTQAPHLLRKQLAEVLQVDEALVRVITPMVGGGFGMKLGVYPEDVLACLHSAATHRPVKWTEDRLEHFRSATHAREAHHKARMGASRDGKLEVLWDVHSIDMGAYHSPFGPPSSSTLTLTGPYVVGSCYTERRIVATNKTPVGAYRGYGAPESNFVCETLMDRMAGELGIDPVEFRLKNMISPEELPYETPSGAIYDGGDFPRCLRMAAEHIGYEAARAALHEASEADGRHRGVGLAAYMEKTGYPGSRGRLGREAGDLRCHEVGHAARHAVRHRRALLGHRQASARAEKPPWRRSAPTRPNLDLDRIRLHIGDTGSSPGGVGSFSSWTTIAASGAIRDAAVGLRRTTLTIAATCSVCRTPPSWLPRWRGGPRGRARQAPRAVRRLRGGDIRS